jgi:hypothetical protein
MSVPPLDSLFPRTKRTRRSGMITLTLDDKSMFHFRFRYNNGDDWELLELYYELPMSGTPPCASKLLDLDAMIPSVRAGLPPFQTLLEGIESHVCAPPSPDSFRESLLK